MAERTVTRKIKSVGNSAMIPVHKADLDALGVQVGVTVKVTIQPVDDAYSATRASALRMRRRFARTLELLGR